MITLGPIKPEKNEFREDDLVCYCFEYTVKDIQNDYKKNGFSRILEKIKTEKKNNGCDCEVKNPKGK